MAFRNKSIQTPAAKILKLSDLQDSSNAWQTFSSAQNQNLMSFLPVARVCDRDLSLNEFTEFQVPKQFISILASSINESLIVHVARLQAFKDSNDEHSEPHNILSEISEQIFPFLRILQAVISKGEASSKINVDMIEQLITFFSLVKSVTVSVMDDPHQLIFRYYILLSDILCLLIIHRKKQGETELKVLNLIYQNLENLLLDICSKPNLLNFALEPIKVPSEFKLSLKFNENSQEVDLSLYIILALNQICRLPYPIGVQLTLSETVPKVMSFILNIQDFRNFQNTSKTRLAIEKSLSVLNLLNWICFLTSKLEHQGKQFLKSNQDKLKGIFYFTVQNYVRFHMTFDEFNFENDRGYLGMLYRLLFDLISLNAMSSDLEGIPIMLFSLYVQSDLIQEIRSHPPQPQAFTLQFIEKLLNLIGKKKTENKFVHMKDFGLIGTLFSRPFFDMDEIFEVFLDNFGCICIET